MKMRLIKGLFRNRNKPTDRTAESSYSFFPGGTASGKYVTERSAMQMTAVYCCVRILSEAVARHLFANASASASLYSGVTRLPA